MQSGKQTLREIDTGLQQIHAEADELDKRIKSGAERVLKLQREQSERFRRLAQIRLDGLISGELGDSLQLADQRAHELIRGRGQKLARLTREIKAAEAQQLEREARREEAGHAVALATDTLDRAEAVTQKHLGELPEYQAQLEATRRAERTAAQAKEKTQQARDNRREKGSPYEDDPLFMYLWRRQYGTAGYRGRGLAKSLDGWVARLCGYTDARPNYAALTEIPQRLREHAEGLQQQADEAFIALTQLETEAAARDGLPALQQALVEAEALQDAVDGEIEAGEEAVRALEHRRNEFANGQDSDFVAAVTTLERTLQGENLLTLYDYARTTATPEDDLIVREMDQARQEFENARDELADREALHQRIVKRQRELEDLRRRFKRKRFDSLHSEFRNDAQVNDALRQFQLGTMSVRELWRALERSQRYRRIQSDPSFGSGGFLPRPGTWHTPFPGGLGRGRLRVPRGGGFSLPGSRSFPSPGGFRTGGGF